MAKDKQQVDQPKSAEKKGKQAGQGSEKKKKKSEQVEIPALPKGYIPRLKVMYNKQVSANLSNKFNYRNVNIIPKLTKIVLNVGIGTLHQDARLAESVADELALISGQKPIFTKAKKSISNFKLREGMTIGCSVTLRRNRMFEFLDRLITYVIPRVRDFKGMSDKSFDGRGNYTFGIKEQIIFPEIDYDKVVLMHGMDLTICTTANNDEEAKELLKEFGFPFRTSSAQTGKDAA
jgi:large subunit ribosomal protein L5